MQGLTNPPYTPRRDIWPWFFLFGSGCFSQSNRGIGFSTLNRLLFQVDKCVQIIQVIDGNLTDIECFAFVGLEIDAHQVGQGRDMLQDEGGRWVMAQRGWIRPPPRVGIARGVFPRENGNAFPLAP